MTEDETDTAPIIARSAPSTEMALNAQRIDFTSKVNGQRYRLLVSAPPGEPPEGGWPVVYLIDGSLHFGTLVDTARIQSRWPDTREAVIVGIAYQTASVSEALTVRNLDLTPPISQAELDRGWQSEMHAKAETFGRLDAYLRMIETEVKPQVAAVVDVDPNDQTLMGHSLGGLATLATLFRTPESFQCYVAISPSIWFNDRWVLQFVDGFAEQVRAGQVRARALISAGEWEQADPPYPPAPKAGFAMSVEAYAEMARACAMVANAKELVERLTPLRGPDFDVQFVLHPQEDHRSVVPAGLARGVAFSLYRP